jgi:hypothetical protein
LRKSAAPQAASSRLKGFRHALDRPSVIVLQSTDGSELSHPNWCDVVPS